MEGTILVGLLGSAALAVAIHGAASGRRDLRGRLSSFGPSAAAGATEPGAALVAPTARRQRDLFRRGARSARARAHDQVIELTVELGASLRSGASILQGLERAANSIGDPLGAQVRGLVAASAAGVPLDRALGAWADRSGDPDVGLLVAVLAMHRRTGGDAPTMLDQIAETVRERVVARREISSMTAQARLSGIVVGVLPIGFFAFLCLTSPRDMASVIGSPTGLAIVALGLVLEGLAFVWIRQILKVAQ